MPLSIKSQGQSLDIKGRELTTLIIVKHFEQGFLETMVKYGILLKGPKELETFQKLNKRKHIK